MPLWLAALLFAACAGGIVFCSVMFYRTTKARYMIFTVLMALVVAAMFVYAGLALLLLGGIT